MSSRFGQLIAVLEEKLRLLQELVLRQQKLQDFLMDPDWRELGKQAEAQAPMVKRIRDLQADQERLMLQIAAFEGNQAPKTLKGLALLLAGEEQAELLGYIEQIGLVTRKLQGVSRVSGMLNQAQAQFMQKWQQELRPTEPVPAVYSPRGYGAYGAGFARLSQEA